MYDIFFVGDFKSETGPAIANKTMREGLKNTKGIIYSNSKSKFFRLFELILKIIVSNNVVFCSSSRLNIYGIKIAKSLKRRTFYIMHGYESYEYKMNNNGKKDDKYKAIKVYEKFIFNNIDKIFCVSRSFMEFMKKREPDFEIKFDYNYNGVNINNFEILSNNDNLRKLNQIVSIGGGMRRKNNLTVCKAIDKINKQTDYDLKYVVIGLPYTDKSEICKYDFVTYYNSLQHNEVLNILRQSNIYIQNSYLETFGISVLEAIFSGCNFIISKYVGARDILTEMDDINLINDPDNIEEIEKKIIAILKNKDKRKIYSKYNKEAILPVNSARNLISKIEGR